ncbi:alpha-2-macroglobulin-like isoform X2 [Oryzias latipes]|uniref:alpha-2-macroglobulin-like isoform X2 n=1 Tax=Oryzias latipes TaxID=8090 RepID=UPI0005CB984D|nr:alpha-2-macroglobulin-like isoform X2 [Oryzias latipes]
MVCPRTRLWIWTLCVLSGMCLGQELTEPDYMVAIPAVLEAGTVNKFCASLLEPNEILTMKVALMYQQKNTTLFEKTSNTEFHECIDFQTPLVLNSEVLMFEVVVQGNTFYSREERKVMIKVYKPGTFVQTDKPIYLPGQTVHFRVVSLDNKLRPANQQYQLIELQDPFRNKIGQWQNKTSNGKILQLSYALSSEARIGSYNIIVKMGEDQVYHTFKVEKYVLPKFDIAINVAKEVSVAQEIIDIEVCAKYTYGQPVPGLLTVKACRPVDRYLTIALCDIQKKRVDKTGCDRFAFEMSNFIRDDKNLQNIIDIHTTLKEDGTEVTHPQGKRIVLSYVIGKLSFIDTAKFYIPGSNFEGKVKAVSYNNTPIANMLLHLSDNHLYTTQTLTTDSNGVATFSLNTTTFNENIRLHIYKTLGHRQREPFYQMESHTVSVYQPPAPNTKSVSTLDVKTNSKPLPCDLEQEIPVHYSLVGEPKGSVKIMYLVLSRGAIVLQGNKKIQIQDDLENAGKITLKLAITPDLAPEFQLVVYAVLPSKHVIASSGDFSTEKCFSNKVSLEFSPSSAVPAEQTKLQLTAHPNSLCGLSAIDQSVLIKEPGKTLNADKIFNILPVKKASSVPHEVEDSMKCLKVRHKRYISRYHNPDEYGANKVFKKAGLKIASNLIIQMPTCVVFKGEIYTRDYGIRAFEPRVDYMLTSSFLHGSSSPPPPIQTARTFFPETWIWDLVEVGESGTKDVFLTAPDTITTWETETFCLSSQGFGLAPRKKLTVFQPFFLELTLPYSIIRGESFELKATVFNYLNSCIMVRVTPGLSTGYVLTPVSTEEYTSCLCDSERKTFHWNMNPTALGVVNITVTAEAIPSHASCDNEIVSVPERGRIDIVTKSLIVKAEGIEVTKTYNWLFCPKGEAVIEETDLQLPENVIDGSVRTTVSVLGDVIGRALRNIEGLLKMPYGCGEQNMALLAPNIYILHYLQNTHQLTPAIKEKAFNFLTSGYQRQLNYKDFQGAYSTFGTGPGNTWLTAFVVRSFFKAKSFVYIDPSVVDISISWLISKQKENGCFEKSGKLFNNRMKGGVSDEVTLSAYITAAFLEMNTSTDNPVVTRSLSCLKGSINDLNNTYTTALLAYVFTLAGDIETRAHLLQHLDRVAVKKGNVIYWTQTAAETSDSLSVEISSYVLMSLLSTSHTAEDLGYASSIVRWMTGQQNYYGGFSSTQDTVAALQALALYATVVFSPEGSSTVKVQSSSVQLEFDVKPDNKLLYQEKVMNDATGKYTLQVKGTACSSIQISQHYNIPPRPNITTLSVEVEAQTNCSDISRQKLTLHLKSLYSGNEMSSNMIILDIKVLTGFVPVEDSLENLKNALLVDRVEQKEDHIVIYLRELKQGEAITHYLKLVQQLPVQNLKPALVKIYDYYQPSDQAETQYISQCA